MAANGSSWTVFSSVEPFVMLCKVVQTSYVLAWNLKFATIYMKATEQYSNPAVLFTILYTVVLPFRVIFESVDEILKCNQSNQCNWAVLSNRTLTFQIKAQW